MSSEGVFFLFTFPTPVSYKSLSNLRWTLSHCMTQRPLLGSMNRSLNHNSVPTVVTVDQWLGLRASKVLKPPQLPQ